MRSRFYMDESYIPRIEKLLGQELTYSIIGQRIGFSKDTVKGFIKRNKIKAHGKTDKCSIDIRQEAQIARRDNSESCSAN